MQVGRQGVAVRPTGEKGGTSEEAVSSIGTDVSKGLAAHRGQIFEA
jgi:hypothetical protein